MTSRYLVFFLFKKLKNLFFIMYFVHFYSIVKLL